MNKPLKVISLLFISLEENGIRHCHWKGNQNLSNMLSGLKDVDLLVDRLKVRECEEILLVLGYKKAIGNTGRTLGIEDWIGYDEETGKLVHLHLHYRIFLGLSFVKEFYLPWENPLLDSAVKDSKNNIYITNPSLELLILGIRMGLELNLLNLISKVNFRKYYVQKEILLKNTNYNELEKWAINLLGQDNGTKFINLIIQDGSYKLITLIKIKLLIYKSLGPYRRIGKLESLIVQMFYILNTVILKILKKQRKKQLISGGIIIAFIGCDGAGKTIITKEIEKWLAGKLDVKRIYLGSGDELTGILKLLKEVASYFINKKDKVQFTKEKSEIKLTRYIWRAIFSKVLYRKILKLKKESCQGKIIITDRYPQTCFSGIYDGPLFLPPIHCTYLQLLSGYELKNYNRMKILSPDILIKLSIPLETAIKRKPDHNKEILVKKIDITSKIMYPGSKVINIDAAAPLEEVINNVKKNLWLSM